MAEGYDPRRSKVSDDTFASFQRDALSGELTDVPGIGPAAAKKLGQIGDGETEFDRVTNTYQLIGKFLMLKGPDEDGNKVESVEHMEKFWWYLKQKGISSHRSGIVRAIAEKVNTMLPGIYDASEYEEDEDDEE
uniref:Uncharacterized protein n=1 Tax=Ditylum brightwellii TaxID=49249 RepID=A0A6U3Z2B1_9STRA|mmetsp:Transcript_6989/g.9305  ORF Transcript_6989/g.9305 Transcript_6989/m.9305 type:complete len:134 (-) Transcript_6989:140-541(-)